MRQDLPVENGTPTCYTQARPTESCPTLQQPCPAAAHRSARAPAMTSTAFAAPCALFHASSTFDISRRLSRPSPQPRLRRQTSPRALAAGPASSAARLLALVPSPDSTAASVAADAASAASDAAEATGDLSGGNVARYLAVYVIFLVVGVTVLTVGVTYQNWVINRNEKDATAEIRARIQGIGGEKKIVPEKRMFSKVKANMTGKSFSGGKDVALGSVKTVPTTTVDGVLDSGNRAMRRRSKLEKKNEKRREKRKGLREEREAGRNAEAEGVVKDK